MRLKLILLILPLLLLVPVYFLYFGDVSTDQYFPLRNGNYWTYHVTEEHWGRRTTSTRVIKVIETHKAGKFKFARLEYKVSRENKTWTKVFTARANGETLRFVGWDKNRYFLWPHLLRFPLEFGDVDPEFPELWISRPQQTVRTPVGVCPQCYHIWGGNSMMDEWWLYPGIGIVKYHDWAQRPDTDVHGDYEEWVLTDYRVR